MTLVELLCNGAIFVVMKISYRTHPILGLIDGQKHGVNIDHNADVPKLARGLVHVLDKYKDQLKKNIIIVSDAFSEAAFSGLDKMIDNELFKELDNEICGVMLFKNLSVIYDARRVVVNNAGAWNFNIIGFYASDCLSTFVWKDIAEYTTESDKSAIEVGKSLWHFVQMILMFKKFADVETKFLPAQQKTKGIDCKYVNETNSNITYLTSHYIQNLYVQGAFKVRGHWRLQPCGQAFKDRKMIWIKDFEKHGYTRQAGKLAATQ
jgi:hypothetical protein